MPTRPLRVNIVVTPEQHALLSEFAELDPDTRSAAGFVRELVDQVTPLLRSIVPAMRVAAQELDEGRAKLREPLRELMATMAQMDLLDAPPHGAPARSGVSREDGRTVRRRDRRPRLDTSQGQ